MLPHLRRSMNLFFDIDGTLLDDKAAITTAALAFFRAFSEPLKLSESSFVSIWEEVLERHFARFARGEISFQEHRRCRIRELFPNETLSNSETDARYEVYSRQYESCWSLFTDARSCLDRLSSLPLGIISNGNSEQQRNKLKRTAIHDRFGVVVISEDIGIGKPAPDIFLAACACAKIHPSQAVYVGDRLDNDAIAARAAGLRGIWLNRLGAPKTRPENVETIYSLDELADALGQ